MSPLAEKLYELIQILPADDRKALLEKIQNGSDSMQTAPNSRGTTSDLPVFTGGKWRAGSLVRDEIYSDESNHALPR